MIIVIQLLLFFGCRVGKNAKNGKNSKNYEYKIHYIRSVIGFPLFFSLRLFQFTCLTFSISFVFFFFFLHLYSAICFESLIFWKMQAIYSQLWARHLASPYNNRIKCIFPARTKKLRDKCVTTTDYCVSRMCFTLIIHLYEYGVLFFLGDEKNEFTKNKKILGPLPQICISHVHWIPKENKTV